MNENEFFEVKKGTKDEIIDRMSEELHLTWKTAEGCLSFLLENSEMLSDDEAIFRYSDIENEEAVSGFITDSMTYYVCLKTVGIYILTFLLSLQDGSVSGALRDVGCAMLQGEQFIIHLKDHPEVKCVLLEFAKNKTRGITLNGILDIYGVNNKNKTECFNNHYLHCRRGDGCCCLTEVEIKNIVTFLEDKGAIKKKHLTGRYYYQI
ncbi:MAG: hypothetical protein LUI14_10975 [Lachnospiraceae bacterium]|nr:hypothetical protein [Lachnospiraceae bacterium]